MSCAPYSSRNPSCALICCNQSTSSSMLSAHAIFHTTRHINTNKPLLSLHTTSGHQRSRHRLINRPPLGHPAPSQPRGRPHLLAHHPLLGASRAVTCCHRLHPKPLVTSLPSRGPTSCDFRVPHRPAWRQRESCCFLGALGSRGSRGASGAWGNADGVCSALLHLAADDKQWQRRRQRTRRPCFGRQHGRCMCGA